MTRIVKSALAPRDGSGIRIAVIDTGIHADHPHVGGITDGVGIDAEGRHGGDVIDRLGHGTAVAAAIRDQAPACELLAVKVFDRRLTTTAAALVGGITWAAAARAHFINLSLGTTNHAHREALAAAVAQAQQAGAVIVAAAPEPDLPWLPGDLPGVIAVEVDWDCPRDECVVTVGSDGAVRVRASGYPRPIPGVPVEQNLRGVSFAVANATGLLALAAFSAAERPTASS